MSFEIKPASDLNAFLLPIFKSFFHFNDFQAQDSLNQLDQFLKDCQDDLYIGVECPYVDKLYRNCYYNYWSSKFKFYPRDCIRLSFFKSSVTINDFFEIDLIENIKNGFLGFLVLRPIHTRIIGRNILSPSFYKKTKDFYVATTNGEAAVNGIKLSIKGFPHSSQDTEMMVCAETSLWAVMEYFSHRYYDYKPLLPHDIHKILAANASFRQIPSEGLNVGQMSYVLKKVGFGVKLHSSSEADFFNTLKIYVESCIPIMAIVNNNKGIVHVMNIVGRTEFSQLGTFSVMENLKSGSVLYNYYEQPCEYLAVDDNLNPYQKITLANPASNYTDPRFAGCQIFAAIIPLYPKVYIEADKAKTFIIEHLKDIDTVFPLPQYVIRIYLTSSRSYKNYISLNPDMSNLVKTLIVGINMPKFIWVAELSTPNLVSANQSIGLIIMDATELIKPEILATFVKNLYIGTIKDIYGAYSLPLQPFMNFNNLNKF